MNILQHKRREERPAETGGSYGSIPGARPEGSAPPPPPYGKGSAPQPVDTRLKSTGLAAFLSGIFPGLGQLYVGYYQRGVTFALTVAVIITAVASETMRGLEPLLGIGIGFIYFLGIIDANRLAHLYNQTVQGLPGMELPEGFRLPQERGSYAGGVILIFLGLLLFLNRNFDFSLEWLEDWWPVGVIGLGIWLIVKARQAKESR